MNVGLLAMLRGVLLTIVTLSPQVWGTKGVPIAKHA